MVSGSKRSTTPGSMVKVALPFTLMSSVMVYGLQTLVRFRLAVTSPPLNFVVSVQTATGALSMVGEASPVSASMSGTSPDGGAASTRGASMMTPTSSAGATSITGGASGTSRVSDTTIVSMAR